MPLAPASWVQAQFTTASKPRLLTRYISSECVYMCAKNQRKSRMRMTNQSATKARPFTR